MFEQLAHYARISNQTFASMRARLGFTNLFVFAIIGNVFYTTVVLLTKVCSVPERLLGSLTLKNIDLVCRSVFLRAHGDAPEAWQIGFQDPATPIMQGIIDLHHDICFFLLVILVFVLWVLARTLYHFHEVRHSQPEKILHGSTIEIAWTILPCLILVLIAVPSFALLYSMDEVVNPAVTVKAIGHQWYWSYEYSDYNESDEQTLAFDSYMIPEDDLQVGQLRLLEVDNRVVLPVNTHIRVIITSADVLHSWAIPSLGVKCDAVPGRLNQTPLFLKREGVFYGQCSELCGANHGFMPIVVESVSLQDYISWVSNKIQEG